MRNIWLLLLTHLLFCSVLFSQDANNGSTKQKTIPSVTFSAHSEQKYGLDIPGKEKPTHFYEQLTLSNGIKYVVPYKSTGYNLEEPVHAILANFKSFNNDQLIFLINDSSEFVPYFRMNDTLLTLQLPRKKSDYFISVRFKGKTVGKLNVEVFKPITEKIAIVSLLKNEIDEEYLEEFLNEIYKQANIKLDVISKTNYSDTLYNDKFTFSNPSAANDRYTDEMRDLRDRYFEQNPSATKNAYYLFIVPGFENPTIKGYMARNQAIGFIKFDNEPDLFHSISRELGHGIGMLDHFWNDAKSTQGNSLNLMDRNSGSELMHYQWLKLRHSSNSYSFYDGDEDLKTKNGMIAYYFWEENKDGFIELDKEHPLTKIIRPYKKNYFSYHLNIQDKLFEILYEWNNYFLCLWHVIIGGLIISSWIIFKIWIRKKRKRLGINPGFFSRKISGLIINFSTLGLLLISFLIINVLLKKFEVKSGLIADFHNQNCKNVQTKTLHNTNLKYMDEEENPKSEILIKRGDDWYMKRKKRVLYFDVYKNEKDEFTRCKFINESDSIILKSIKFKDEAQSHYFVFNFKNNQDSLESQKIFNHLGFDLTDKLNLEDPAKRILLLVNGYRPTSVGHSFEENFEDIKKNGLEHPNSSNLIYDFDRYNYWSPWQKMDARFKKKINPSETYYADGHFSVTTSNHRSLLNFTHLSTIYPKRCKNAKKHTCWKTTKNSTGIFGDKKVNTYDLLPTASNKKGFKERYENGKIAAKNLLQIFNEIPNKSANDTIYIVAHSMGYAYSLGMIDVLRGKINFGGFYILAPENAGQGIVNRTEWKEVWQYGSELNQNKKDAPCLQDGVAPQTCAGGLSEINRCYIPDRFYHRKGFFDSHFIGYYTWIFNLEKDQKGAIKQR